MRTKTIVFGMLLGLAGAAAGLHFSPAGTVGLASEAKADMGVMFKSGDAAIKYRKSLMKAVGGHMTAISLTLKEGDGVGGIAEHADALAALAKMTETAFPAKSGPMDGETEALPAVWEKPDEFKKVTMAFSAETAKLAEVAKGGNKEAIGAQLGALGKNGCKACHDSFREKK